MAGNELVKEAMEALRPFAECIEYIEEGESDEEWAKFRLLVKNYRSAKTTFDKLETALGPQT
jgi:hypothetical protein